ncbi:MAG: hypothetical protein M3Y87_16720 [Myxococcota bacterium]|nr:hypothetical protein [Myxococcota bacterium]
MRASRLAIAASLVVALGGGCDATATCVDRDLDGLGEGCAAGPDCDDDNAARGIDCDAEPAPDCELDPSSTGCPCLIGSVTNCFAGPPEAAGVGLCTPGRARCVAGRWGLCDGSQAPRAERCDGADQDCDGRSDEGVRSPCGGCTAACTGELWGEPFEEDAPSLAITHAGELTLARVERASATVWVANSADGTASRIDAASAIETARYATGDRDGAVALEPSRVAVDWNGDAWIANRAFEGISSAVRFAGTPERCVDRDLDGVVETSSGPDDLRAWGQDECVLASVPVGAEREIARAIAIDGDRGLDGASGGDAWIGLHDGQAFVELDGLTGDVKQRVETPGFSPYSAAFDPWGRLWAIARDGLLARIDPSVEPPEVRVTPVPLACWLLYGLAIDAEGRIAMTGFSCDRVTLHDPQTERFTTLAVPESPRGATFAGDDLWVAHTGGSISRLTVAPLRMQLASRSIASDGTAPLETIGMGADGLGHVWAISSSGGPEGVGVATRIDAATGVPSAQVGVGLAPHSQGDPTGGELRGEFVPEGSATRAFEGCGAGEPTRWSRVHVAADLGTRGRVRFEVRHAATFDALGAAPWVVLGELPEDPAPFELALPEGGVIEVRATLTVSARTGAPRLRRVGVEWRCPGPE